MSRINNIIVFFITVVTIIERSYKDGVGIHEKWHGVI